MKKLLFGMLMTISLALLSGCAGTPGYSGGLPSLQSPDVHERGEMPSRVLRNIRYESLQCADDFYTFWLLDPASHLTKWNVR